jgi:dolichyldiphosphatase
MRIVTVLFHLLVVILGTPGLIAGFPLVAKKPLTFRPIGIGVQSSVQVRRPSGVAPQQPLLSRYSRSLCKMSTKKECSSSNDEECCSSSLINKVVVWIGSTTSMTVAALFFAALAYKRDALMVSFFIGAISNGILSKVLKKLLNQKRPSDISVIVKEQPSDNGMPSSHAMSLGFIGMFTGLTLPQTHIPILCYVAISLYYRVQTQLHTKEQVAVGLMVGMMNGAIWRYLCSNSVMDWVSNTLLNSEKLLPYPLLVVPAVVGVIVVGSFERRIKKWIKSD